MMKPDTPDTNMKTVAEPLDPKDPIPVVFQGGNVLFLFNVKYPTNKTGNVTFTDQFPVVN